MQRVRLVATVAEGNICGVCVCVCVRVCVEEEGMCVLEVE